VVLIDVGGGGVDEPGPAWSSLPAASAATPAKSVTTTMPDTPRTANGARRKPDLSSSGGATSTWYSGSDMWAYLLVSPTDRQRKPITVR
jgi:hypothetical protein